MSSRGNDNPDGWKISLQCTQSIFGMMELKLPNFVPAIQEEHEMLGGSHSRQGR